MGDGIMALFGAPLAHEDHATRGCYAALQMQESIKRYAEEVRQSLGVAVRIRVGLNSGEVIVRTIRSDLRMDYTAVARPPIWPRAWSSSRIRGASSSRPVPSRSRRLHPGDAARATPVKGLADRSRSTS